MINVNATRQRTWVPFATVFFAMVLLVIPAPELIRDFLPDWVSLVLIYWALALPTRMRVSLAWLAGLAQKEGGGMGGRGGAGKGFGLRTWH